MASPNAIPSNSLRYLKVFCSVVGLPVHYSMEKVTCSLSDTMGAGDWLAAHTLALLLVGVKALHITRRSPQPGTEVQSTLGNTAKINLTYSMVNPPAMCEGKYLPTQSASDPHANFDLELYIISLQSFCIIALHNRY